MNASYRDILEALGPAVTPSWYDEHGVPRFAVHHPKLSPDIYADEIALLLISCQSCGTEFRVQMTSSSFTRLRAQMFRGCFGEVAKMLIEALDLLEAAGTAARVKEMRARLNELRSMPVTSLRDSILAGTIHYGDPPNAGCCPAGPTMNCWDLRVLEFWHQHDHEWRRDPVLERELPDLHDEARVRL